MWAVFHFLWNGEYIYTWRREPPPSFYLLTKPSVVKVLLMWMCLNGSWRQLVWMQWLFNRFLKEGTCSQNCMVDFKHSCLINFTYMSVRAPTLNQDQVLPGAVTRPRRIILLSHLNSSVSFRKLTYRWWESRGIFHTMKTWSANYSKYVCFQN